MCLQGEMSGYPSTYTFPTRDIFTRELISCAGESIKIYRRFVNDVCLFGRCHFQLSSCDCDYSSLLSDLTFIAAVS